MNDKEILEKIYEKPGVIWTMPKPHTELVELVGKSKIKSCKVLEIGCGEGRDAIYLASKGFNVTAIDISEKAIQYAKENAKKAGVKVKFEALDFNKLSELKERFDFVLEWAIIHFIPYEKRKKYVEEIANLLNPQGKYVSACFNVQCPVFGKAGERVRDSGKSAPGLKHYFSTQEEIKNLFGPFFHIIETKIKIGKTMPTILNYFFMEKK